MSRAVPPMSPVQRCRLPRRLPHLVRRPSRCHVAITGTRSCVRAWRRRSRATARAGWKYLAATRYGAAPRATSTCASPACTGLGDEGTGMLDSVSSRLRAACAGGGRRHPGTRSHQCSEPRISGVLAHPQAPALRTRGVQGAARGRGGAAEGAPPSDAPARITTASRSFARARWTRPTRHRQRAGPPRPSAAPKLGGLTGCLVPIRLHLHRHAPLARLVPRLRRSGRGSPRRSSRRPSAAPTARRPAISGRRRRRRARRAPPRRVHAPRPRRARRQRPRCATDARRGGGRGQRGRGPLSSARAL